MFYRIKQFVKGIFAKAPNAQEKLLVDKILPEKARRLFYNMNRADQRHSLQVMYTAEQIWHSSQEDDENDEPLELLRRCCLLHDVGRGRKMGSIRKSWAVILDKVHPIWSRRHGRCDSRSYVRGLLYRYYHHGEISGEMLMSIGLAQEARIVALHHKKSKKGLAENEIKLLNVLRQADGMN